MVPQVRRSKLASLKLAVGTLLMCPLASGGYSGGPRLQSLVLAADKFRALDWGVLAAAAPAQLTVCIARELWQLEQLNSFEQIRAVCKASNLALYYPLDGLQTSRLHDVPERVRSLLLSRRVGSVATVEP